MCAIAPLLLCVCGTGAGDHSHYRFSGVSVDAVGKMLLVTAIWMITIWGGFVLVARVYKHMATLVKTGDKLYTDFQTV